MRLWGSYGSCHGPSWMFICILRFSGEMLWWTLTCIHLLIKALPVWNTNERSCCRLVRCQGAELPHWYVSSMYNDTQVRRGDSTVQPPQHLLMHVWENQSLCSVCLVAHVRHHEHLTLRRTVRSGCVCLGKSVRAHASNFVSWGVFLVVFLVLVLCKIFFLVLSKYI